MRGLIALLLAATLVVGCQAAASPTPTPQRPNSGVTPPTSQSPNSGVTPPTSQLPSSDVVPPAPQRPNSGVTPLQNLYYQRSGFAAATAQPADYTVTGRLRGGMLPHHLLAGDMIAGWWREAGRQHKQEPYDGILLVSPSHFPENCGSDVVTANARWRTHLGDIQPDGELVAAILANELVAAEDNPKAVEQDHGAAGHTPFIRKYLPDVPLTVCLLSNKLPAERLREFWELVSEQALQHNLLVVASVDCSHYLTPEQSSQCDTQTIAAITERNRGLLLSMSDRNVDSPQSVTTMLAVADALDGELTLLGHSSSLEKLPVSLDHEAHAEGLTTYTTWAITTQ